MLVGTSDTCFTLNFCKSQWMGSGYGSVGRAVDSDTQGPRFESSHWQIFKPEHLFTVHCIGKTKIKEKEARDYPFFKKNCQ